MRVLMLVLGLVVAPFVAGVAQGQQGGNCDNGKSGEHRSAQGQAHAHQGLCADAPPSCAVTSPVSLSTGASLSGWCVTLSGPVAATTATDGSGVYSFTGLAAGTYT